LEKLRDYRCNRSDDTDFVCCGAGGISYLSDVVHKITSSIVAIAVDNVRNIHDDALLISISGYVMCAKNVDRDLWVISKT